MTKNEQRLNIRQHHEVPETASRRILKIDFYIARAIEVFFANDLVSENVEAMATIAWAEHSLETLAV